MSNSLPNPFDAVEFAPNLDPFGMPLNPADRRELTAEELAEIHRDPEFVAYLQQLESACRE